MATLEVRRFDEPDELNALPLLTEQVVVAGRRRLYRLVDGADDAFSAKRVDSDG
jgi:hypothetical protein